MALSFKLSRFLKIGFVAFSINNFLRVLRVPFFCRHFFQIPLMRFSTTVVLLTLFHDATRISFRKILKYELRCVPICVRYIWVNNCTQDFLYILCHRPCGGGKGL
jgi:hypothetical protein